MPTGFIDVADIEDIEAKVVVSEVLGLARNKYKLRELCRVIKMPDLLGDMPVATRLAGIKHVPPLKEAELSKEAYTWVHFDLEAYGKNVVHIAISYEAGKKKNLVGDILASNVKDAAGAIAQMENEDIASVLPTGFANQTGSDWGGDNDPSDDVMEAIATMINLDKGYEPTYLAMNPLVWADLVSNDYVRKQMERNMMVKGEVPTYCGLKVLTDVAITPNTSCFVLATEAPALVLGDGPSMVQKYSGNAAFYTGYAIAKFAEPKVVQADAGIEITGVHA